MIHTFRPDTAPDLALNLIRAGMPRSDVRTVIINSPVTLANTGVIVLEPKNTGGTEAPQDPDRDNSTVFPDLYAAQRGIGADDTIVISRTRLPGCLTPLT